MRIYTSFLDLDGCIVTKNEVGILGQAGLWAKFDQHRSSFQVEKRLTMKRQHLPSSGVLLGRRVKTLAQLKAGNQSVTS